MYCYIAHSARDCFGSIGIKQGTQHAILNTQYSAHEYETNTAKLIEHMKSTWEWWEFFSYDLCPFGYNETIAHEYFPLEKEEVIKRWWKWKEDDETTSYHGEYYTPLPIDQYDEDKVGLDTAKANIETCLKEIHKCETTWKPFKIIKQELLNYIQNNLPLPTKHPDQRHLERMQVENNRKLYERECDKCNSTIQTTYTPDRKEKVYCEKCFHKEVY